MKYELVPRRFFRLKPEFIGKGVGPETVSFYGALPSPREAYEIAEKGFSIYDSRNNTYSNYFFGKIGIETREEGEDIIRRLDAKDRQNMALSSIYYNANVLEIAPPPIDNLLDLGLDALEKFANELSTRARLLTLPF